MLENLYVKSEKSDFLDEEQKELKGKITQELLQVMHANISYNLVTLKLQDNNQALSAIILNSFIMFAREIMKGFIINVPNNLKEKALDEVLRIVKEECMVTIIEDCSHTPS